MVTPSVRFRTPDGALVDVPAGGIIGRLSSAALRVDDPLVSEAHALVSLRGAHLKLLALRGWLEVDGNRSPDVVLRSGQRIALAQGLALEVDSVRLPSHVIAIVGLGPEPVELSSGVYSVVVRPPPGLSELKPGFQGNASAHVFSSTDGWRIRIRNQPPEDVLAGARWEIEGVEVSAVALPLGHAGAQDTLYHRGRIYPPTHITARYETVHIVPEGGPPVVLVGVPARIVSELCALAVPAAWEMVAAEIWKDEADRHLLRQNWDRNLRSLRARLRQHGLREDLVRPDGRGNVELFLLPGDIVTLDL